MFKLRYDFGEYNNVIARYMEKLFNTSGTNFQEQFQNGKLGNYEHERTALIDCIGYLEEYLYYNYKKYPAIINGKENTIFKDISNSIFDNLKAISLLPKNNRGIYGFTQNGIVYINPDLQKSRTLTGKERTRLYMAHELGHAINASWMKKFKEFANQLIRQGKLTQEKAQLFFDGFSMLDEVIAQNRAEDFTYEFSKKRRPKLTKYRNKRLFNGETYKSNFDFYGELQEPAIMFARTLRGIGRVKDDERVLYILSERGFSPYFLHNIVDEYSRDGQMPSLMKEVQCMGYLKKAAYANFGKEDPEYLRNSKKYLDILRELTSNLRDYREPYDGNR